MKSRTACFGVRQLRLPVLRRDNFGGADCGGRCALERNACRAGGAEDGRRQCARLLGARRGAIKREPSS
eukprot:6195857-Pleurochrysis_carterae.AAC.1